MYNFRRIILGLACIVLLGISGFGVATQGPISNRILPRTEITGLGTGGLLSALAAKYRVPIGLEEARSDTPETAQTTSMNLPEGTVGSFLDVIIGSDSRYRWKEIDGVIEVYPKINREALLDVVIHEFSVEGDRSPASVANSICHLPEVTSRMASLGITAFNPEDMSLGRVTTRHFSIHVRDVTLRDLLNQIARNSEYHFWSVGRWAPKNEIVTLEF